MIVVTRPNPQGSALCQQLQAAGYETLHFPTIDFAGPPDPVAFTQAIAEINTQDWLIFTSPRAVLATIGMLDKHSLATVKIAAIGEGTAGVLRKAGVKVQVVPQEWNSEGLLALPALLKVSQQKIAIIRGEGGRACLEPTLRERGAVVTSIIAYQRVLPNVSITVMQEALKQRKIQAIICASYEAVENLQTLLGPEKWVELHRCPLIVISERIKKLAQGLGFQTIWIKDLRQEIVL